MNYFKFYFLFIALFTTSFLYGQKITVQGIIKDNDTGLVLIGASVIGNDGEVATITDDDGKFVIPLTPRDTITLNIAYLGYEKHLVKLASYKEKEEALIIFLKRITEDIDEVVVSAAKFEQKREEVTVSIAAIKPKQLDQQASNNIKKVLDQTPGVVAYQNQLNIRGSNGYTYGVGSRVAVLLDGLPLLTADQSSVDFEFLPTDNIKNIEILKGASSVMYGAGALGGTINVFTNRPSSTPMTSIRISQEVFDRPKSNPEWKGISDSSGHNNGFHAFHSRRIGNLDFTAQADIINDRGYRIQEFQRTYRGMIGLHYFPKKLEGLRFGVNVSASIDTMANFLTWASYPAQTVTPGNISLTGQSFTKIVIDPRISYVTQAGHRHLYIGRNYLSDRDTDEGNSKSATYFNEYQYMHRLNENFTLIGGLNFTRSTVDAELFGNHSTNSYGAFLQAEARFNKRLNLSGGIRYMYETLDGEKIIARPVGRLGANYRFGEATFVRASLGQGVRTPSVAERYSRLRVGSLSIRPQPDLKIEKGYSAELGVRQLFEIGHWRGFADLALFQMRFTDMIEFQVAEDDSIDFINLNALFEARNIANARVNGFEFVLGTEARLGDLTLRINGGYTFIDPSDLDGQKAQDGQYDVVATLLDTVIINSIFPLDYSIVLKPNQPYTLKYRNKHLLRAGAELAFDDFSLTANYRYSSRILNYDMLFFYEPWQLKPAIKEGAIAYFGGEVDEEFLDNFVELFSEQSAPFIAGAYDYQTKSEQGGHFLDFILAMNWRKHTISLHAFNILNTEYMAVPGLMLPHRSYAAQLVLRF